MHLTRLNTSPPNDLMTKREKVTQPDVHVIDLSALDPERGMSLLNRSEKSHKNPSGGDSGSDT